jgi:hypothetical protein
MALEAQAGNLKGSLTSSTPPTVATDEDLNKIWNFEDTWKGSLRALYDLGVAHGQANHIPDATKMVPVAGEVGELVADLRAMATQAGLACQPGDFKILTRAANMLQQLGERVPAKGDEPAPAALVRRVAYAITGDSDGPIHWKTEARDAILEVARWLRSHGINVSANVLEQELGR